MLMLSEETFVDAPMADQMLAKGYAAAKNYQGVDLATVVISYFPLHVLCPS